MTDLNPQQKEAVETTSGPLLILAGAGSGKTRVLTYRIFHLIQQNLAYPENILAVTFTNKAAAEMKERIQRLLSITPTTSYNLPWVGTFHSICVKILKQNSEYLGINPLFSIYDRADQIDAVKEAMVKLNIDNKKINPNAVLNHISGAKNELISPSSYADVAVGFFQMTVASIYPEYQKILKDNSALDFDDLIMQTVKLFEKEEHILNRYRELFRFILVDEYQDTNHAQYKLTKLLAHSHKNICVVGDDAQSIYSFRGATIRNILEFEKDYPEAKVVKLEQNYRSTKTILEASNKIISLNPKQKQKNLWTDNMEGEMITKYQALDEKDEANWVASKIKEIESNDIAVLYRTNAQSRALEEALINRGISYQIVGSVEFYKRKEVKDVLAYLRVIQNPLDNLSLKRIINVPRRGIGPTTYAKLEQFASESGKSVINYLLELDQASLNNWSKGVIEFGLLMKKLFLAKDKVTVDDLINLILDASGYKKSLDDGTSENETRLENIKELITVAKAFSKLEPIESLERFLDEISLIQGHENIEGEEPKVRLMTVHSAKGLEFDYLFIVGMEEGIFPHSNSYLDPEQMAEERRLAYVALTRARQKVYITHTQSRTYFGSRNSNPVSRFVSDIPEELIEEEGRKSVWDSSSVFTEFEQEETKPVLPDLEVGDIVEHEIFGKGKVQELDDYLIVISFAAGIKELSLEYTTLKKLS